MELLKIYFETFQETLEKLKFKLSVTFEVNKYSKLVLARLGAARKAFHSSNRNSLDLLGICRGIPSLQQVRSLLWDHDECGHGRDEGS
jgi:hypothetical protein